MDVEGKLQLKDVDADDFGAMRSQFVVMKRIVDELLRHFRNGNVQKSAKPSLW